MSLSARGPRDLEERVRHLEKRFYAAAVVAAIFGLTGAWGVKAIFTAYQQIEELDNRISSLNSAMPKIEKQYHDAANSLNDETVRDVGNLTSAAQAILLQNKKDIDAYLAARSADILSEVAAARRAADAASATADAALAAQRDAAAKEATAQRDAAAKEAAAQQDAAAREAAAKKESLRTRGYEWPCPTLRWNEGRCSN